VKQSRTNGNPWEVANFPSHSGNISWGHEGTENLQTGDSRGVDNVDIAFASPTACYYAHWYSVMDVDFTATQIREQMFEKGALADTTIVSDTAANMQLAMDAEANRVLPDYPCGIEIGFATEGDFTLTLDNITFNDRCSMPIRYVGANILTVVLANGSDLVESKCGTPYGGTIVFVRPALLTLTGLQNPSEVRVYEAGTQTEVAGQESVTTGVFSATVSVASVDIHIVSLAYKILTLTSVDTTVNVSLPIQQQIDRNYSNPL